MNLQHLKLQAAACGGLLAILAAEWSYGQLSLAELQKYQQPASEQHYTGSELPQIDVHAVDINHYAQMVERPLFNESRKPLVVDAPDEVATEDTGSLDDWDLIGVYTRNKQPTALFRRKNDLKQFSKITTAQSISGWTLTQILPDKVNLQQAGQQKTVLLIKKRVEARIAEQSAKRPPPAPVSARPPVAPPTPPDKPQS